MIWACSFEKKRKWELFTLLFKVFSWNTGLWDMLGDFTVKMQNLESESVLNWKSIK